MDSSLPFGLWSAPKLFNTVADALCLEQVGIRYMDHCLDDYITVAPPNTRECAELVAVLEEVCARSGVQMAPGKKEGPTTALMFLEIAIDIMTGELRLPEDKRQRLNIIHSCHVG